MFTCSLLNLFETSLISGLGQGPLGFSYLDVGEGSWGEDELVESSEKCSHEGVGLSDIDFSSVVKIEFSPGSWEEFGHVCFHLSL